MKDRMNFSDGSKVFFTSDTHFGHRNAIDFAGRPFSSVEDMDEALTANWNATVPEDGIVFHLGDFCYGGAPVWKRIAERLHGRKYLVMGNHDFKNYEPDCARHFEAVSQQMYVCIEEQRIYLNHHPFLAYGGSYAGTWQLFGHVHSGPESKSGRDLPRLAHLLPTQYDVGVDNNGYRPVSFREVREVIGRRCRAAEEDPNKRLFDAVCSLDLERMRAAVGDGANVNCADFEKRTSVSNLIHYAVRRLEETGESDAGAVCGRIRRAVRYLLSRGADPSLNPEGAPGAVEPVLNRVLRNGIATQEGRMLADELASLLRFYGVRDTLDRRRVLFLDIDGVLTSDSHTQRCILECRKENPYGLDWFDPACVCALERIIRRTGAKIVISSSWRELGLDKLRKVWEAHGLPGEVIGTTPEWILTKREAIREWLGAHECDAYVILDDDEIDLPHHLRPDGRRGLFPEIEDLAVREFDIQIK